MSNRGYSSSRTHEGMSSDPKPSEGETEEEMRKRLGIGEFSEDSMRNESRNTPRYSGFGGRMGGRGR